jgi:parallel beta-helix repeat protein
LLNFWDEKVRSETIVGGVIMPPGKTWTVGGSPYIINFDLEILPGATLTIDPDVVVLFNGYYSMLVNGNLMAIGTKTNRISIESNMVIPLPGDWNRIQIGPGGHAEIKYCDISFGTYGIYLNSLSNNEITDNNIAFNGAYGIYLDSSTGDLIANNTMTENGLGIFGDSIEHWNTHNIETSNTVTGKPVHYWRNKTGGTIPPGAGQVILGNCTNVNIENQDLVKGSIGIELGFSTIPSRTITTAASCSIGPIGTTSRAMSSRTITLASISFVRPVTT